MTRQLFKGDEEIYRKWYNRALQDETVWPYFGRGKYLEPHELQPSDWCEAFFLGPNEIGLLKIWNGRANGNEMNCSLWVLNEPNKQPEVAALLEMVPRLAKRFGLDWIAGGCMESNAASMNLHKRIFGEPCGRFEEAAWNPLTGKWETQYSFRARVSEILSRPKPF